jgi:hypothetical protein
MATKVKEENKVDAYQNLIPMGMVYTPKTLKELEGRIESYGGTEKVAFMLGLYMAWNLCAKIQKENEAFLLKEKGVDVHKD